MLSKAFLQNHTACALVSRRSQSLVPTARRSLCLVPHDATQRVLCGTQQECRDSLSRRFCPDQRRLLHSSVSMSRQRWFSSGSSDSNAGRDDSSVETTEDTGNPLMNDLPGTQTGGKKLAIVFTCKVCNTRSAKQFSERAYKHGVVLARCPGCENLHLIADRLGMFEDGGDWDIEKALTKLGENVVAANNDNVLEVTVRDVLGDKLDEAIAAMDSNKD